MPEIDTSVRCFHHSELISKTNEQKINNQSNKKIKIDEILEFKRSFNILCKTGILDQFLNKVTDSNPTVKDINININKGETIALVGESGSGKSTILKSIAGLLKTKDGNITFDKEKVLSGNLKERSSEDLRSIQLIFQNPDESLNPNHTVEQILSQPLKLYFGLTGSKLKSSIIELLEKVRLRCILYE